MARNRGGFLMTNANSHDPIENRILAALPRKQYERLLPHLKKIDLTQGEILHQSGDRIEQVYFPNSGMVSLVTVMSDGACVEVGVVGREGMVGIPLVLGDDISQSQAIVQVADGAMKLRANILREEIERGGELQNLLQRFVIAHLKQISQTAACNRNHHIGERLAYWLLTCQDSVGNSRLRLTQDFISQMLGVRRAGVSEAAMTLQGLGLIQYSRGDITILDRAGLEEFSCECFKVVREEFKRLLGGRSNSNGARNLHR
jgi:CRP-like cAMP-binding protein